MALRIGILSNTTDLGVMVVRNLLIKLLREKYPDARLMLLAESANIERVRTVYEQISWLDEFVPIDAEPPKTPEQEHTLREQLASCALDMLIFNPQSKMPYRIAAECGIKRRIGFAPDESQLGQLTDSVILDVSLDRDLHWSYILAGYARALGIDHFRGVAAHVPFLRVRSLEAHVHAVDAGPRIAIHVGGNIEWNRRWPLSNFVRLCRDLVRECNATLFLLGSPDEADENRTIAEEIRNDGASGSIVDVSGARIEHTVRCIASAALFVGNDSGPMNIAVAVGTPVVALRGADPENFRPDVVDPRHIVVSRWHECARFLNGSHICDRGCPVAYDRRKQDYPKCMASIPYEEVWAAAMNQLRSCYGDSDQRRCDRQLARA